MAEQPFTVTTKRGYKIIQWSAMTTGDTATATSPLDGGAVIGSIETSGTFNGGTSVSLQVSNAGTNFYTIKDVAGDAVTMTAVGYAEFSTAGLYIKPIIGSGSADSVVVTVVVRGE